MIVQSVSIGDTSRQSGTSATRVIPQSTHFGSQKPHSAPHTTVMSRLASNARAYVAGLGLLALPVAAIGCDRTDTPEYRANGNATFGNEGFRPDGGVPDTMGELQLRPIDEIDPCYGTRPAQNPNVREINPSLGPQLPPEQGRKFEPMIFDEASEAAKALKSDAGTLSKRVGKTGTTVATKVGTILSHLA